MLPAYFALVHRTTLATAVGMYVVPASSVRQVFWPGNRCRGVSRISTGTGDDGTTGLVDGSRLPKAHLRVEAVGAVDEVNDALGLAASAAPHLGSALAAFQEDLFVLGADLATPGDKDGPMRLGPDAVERVERETDRLEAELPPLRHFILPGGAEPAARLFVARGLARRAERAVWRLATEQSVNRYGLVYLNRLSDMLFLLARAENRRASVAEPEWRPRKR